MKTDASTHGSWSCCLRWCDGGLICGSRICDTGCRSAAAGAGHGGWLHRDFRRHFRKSFGDTFANGEQRLAQVVTPGLTGTLTEVRLAGSCWAPSLTGGSRRARRSTDRHCPWVSDLTVHLPVDPDQLQQRRLCDTGSSANGRAVRNRSPDVLEATAASGRARSPIRMRAAMPTPEPGRRGEHMAPDDPWRGTQRPTVPDSRGASRIAATTRSSGSARASGSGGQAGVAVSFKVARSDNAKPLTKGTMICDPSIQGK